MSTAVEIQHVHILGAGRMGQGIALAFAYAGLRVTLIDFKDREPAARSAFAAAARGEIVRQLQTQVVFGRISEAQAAETMARIVIVDRERAREGLAEGEIVFEAVPEVMEAKQVAFAWLCEHGGTDVLFASTTSTFLVTELQQVVVHPGRSEEHTSELQSRP